MSRSLRRPLAALFAASLGLANAGCSSALFSKDLFTSVDLTPSLLDEFGTEQRVITQFTDAREEDNESAFRKVVSTRFEQKALRSKDAYQDLEILKLPKSALEVVESTEIEGSEFKAREVVAKDESGTKYQFQILRDPEKRRWVVDDVLIRQQKKGTRASKSAVDVMDLLLTVRDFLNTWQTGERQAVLVALSADLRNSMESLPEPWFRQLTSRMASEYETGMARRPEAQLNESDAVVKMPSKNGFLLMKVNRENDQWLVADMEVRNRKTDEHPGSILRQARALQCVTSFLDAYQAGDPEQVRTLSEKQFFDTALKVGDFSTVRLPDSTHAPDNFELRSYAGQLTMILPEDGEIVRLELVSSESGSAELRDRRNPETQPVESRFVVSEITLYDRTTQRQRTLKSTFAAPARAQVFLASLEARDLPMIRRLSSQAMTESIWTRLRPELLPLLNLQQLPSSPMTLQDTHVRGDVTELVFLSGDGRLLSVNMTDENGELKVDDLQFPGPDARIMSMRNQLQLNIPVTELAIAWKNQDLSSVQKNCSMDFNRLVWSNVRTLPHGFEHLPEHLLKPVIAEETSDQQAQLRLASPGQMPVTVRLVQEQTAWVVDEIELPRANGRPLELRKSLRQEIAQRFLDNPDGGITTAMYSLDANAAGSGVRRANASEDSDQVAVRRGNLTLPSSTLPRKKAISEAIDMTPEPDPMPRSPEPDETGVLRFGPNEDNAEESGDDSEFGSAASAESEPEHDEVLLFRGRPGEPAGAAARPEQSFRDLSQHPIRIPVE